MAGMEILVAGTGECHGFLLGIAEFEYIQQPLDIAFDGSKLGHDFIFGGGQHAEWRDMPVEIFLGQHQCTIDEVAKDGDQLIVVASLKVTPREVIVLGLRGIGREDIAQHILLAGEVAQIFVQPDSPVACRRDFVSLKIEKLVGRHVVGQDIRPLGLEHRGEDDAVEDDVVLADEVDETCLGIFPPLLPRVGQQFFCIRYITNRGIKPDIQHLAVSTFHRDGYTPVEVTAHGTGLKPHVEPALALSIDIGTPLFVLLEYPLAQPRLMAVERQIPMPGLTHHRFRATDRRVRIDELGGTERRAAGLALVSIGAGIVAVRTFAHDVTVGESCTLEVVLEYMSKDIPNSSNDSLINL